MRDEIIKRNIIITIGSLFIFFILSFYIFSYSNRKSLEEQLINVSKVVNNQLLLTNTEEEAFKVVNEFTKNQEWLNISIATSQGFIVKDSSDDAIGETYYLYISEEELDKVAEDSLEKNRVYIKDDIVYFITKLSDDMIVRTSVKVQTNTTYILNNLFYMLLLILGVLMISILYTRKTSKLIIDAFSNISSHLKTINEGEYLQIETHHKFREVEESLEEINEINKNIYSSILKIKNEHDKINFIINNMQQGIIIIDEFEQILLINDYARISLEIKEETTNLINHNYHDIINEVLNKKIETALEKKNNLFFDYLDEIKEKIYSCTLTNLKNKWNEIDKSVGLLVIVIMDVTEERTNDKMKADFIANASHELKTPITSIRGFSELMLCTKNNYDDDTLNYLNIIYEESLKMKNTIEELLYLSNLEYNRNNIELNEKVYFKEIVNELIESYSSLSKAENVTIYSDIEDLYIVDSSLLLKHLIANLLENAIRYNKINGSVYIKVKKENNYIVLVVSDTGVGIENRHLDKIFDRFYRVDNSRNRNTGGTGLGLNLVKQICAILNAKISVESTVNVGTTFTIIFNSEEQ